MSSNAAIPDIYPKIVPWVVPIVKYFTIWAKQNEDQCDMICGNNCIIPQIKGN